MIKRALIISSQQLLGYPTYRPREWENYSRKAYVEPIIIRDGLHDYVLMSVDDYRRLDILAGLDDDARAQVEALIRVLKE